MISISEYEILQFTKRGYTSKYPGFSIPSKLSSPSVKKIIKYLQTALAFKLANKTDEDADKFDGRKSNYEEKISMQKE